MADTYASRDARRRAAMAEALLSNSMTAPQGGMVGRYYVGEGIGGGLARIGQALMANRIGGKADEAEAEYQAGQRAARAKSMNDLVSTISTPVTDVRETADGVGPMPMRKPSNQEIGAALLKYQNDTGSEIPKDIIGLMAPGAGGNDTAFGSTLRKDGRTFQLTKSGQLIDLGEGFDEPTRVLDLGGQLVVTPTSGVPKPVATFSKGVSPDKVYDVNAAPDKAAAVAAAEAEARAKAERDQVARDAEKAQSDINAILGEAEGLIGKGTGSAFGALMSDLRVKTNSANEKDAVNARLKVLSGNLLGEFAKSKILGTNPTDPDRKMYEEMAGKIGDPTLDPSVRFAALDQVRKMAAARAASARGSSQPQSKPSASKPMKWNPATKRVE